jgi:hypothetical protein
VLPEAKGADKLLPKVGARNDLTGGEAGIQNRLTDFQQTQ